MDKVEQTESERIHQIALDLTDIYIYFKVLGLRKTSLEEAVYILDKHQMNLKLEGK